MTFQFGDAETLGRCRGSEDPSEFAEAYADGRMAVDGPLEEAARVALAMRDLDPGLAARLAVISRLGIPASRHTAMDDERDVRAHYDLSDDFFKLFLDSRMVYSCAYFETLDQSLEDAQARKLDLICRKLALAPGDEFLDIGSGWGALLIWAASRYGARAHGLTLSVNQAEESRRRIAELLPVSTVLSALEDAGFEVLDVQSLRPHYALTLRAWYDRFQRRRAEAVRLTSERTARMWEVYLTGCARTFELGLVAVHQILAAKPGGDPTRRPLTRTAWDLDLAK